MSRVDSDAWIPKAKKRKAYRDHYREKFFAEVGLRKGSDVQTISGAPSEQASLVSDLLKITAKGDVIDPVQKTMIQEALGRLSAFGLGTGQMGSQSSNKQLFRTFSTKQLREHWFYSPAVFE